jgi:TetR/AcrR family transcriptional repressor of nem operon
MDTLAASGEKKGRSVAKNSGRARILEKAYELVMVQGFAATSIDMILEASGVKKGTFFYHFKSKAELAASLANIYIDQGNSFFSSIIRDAQAEEPHPVRMLLLFIERLAASYETKNTAPGCLFASFSYDQHTEEMAQLMDEQMTKWKRYYSRFFKRAVDYCGLEGQVNPDYLASYFVSTTQGAFIVGRINRDPQEVAVQLRMFKHYVSLLFGEVPAPSRSNAGTASLALA